MEYVTRKKEPPKEIPKAKPKPKSDPYKRITNDLSGLLVTAIKQNGEVARVHAAQINKAISDIGKMNAKAPVVTVKPYGTRTFHMDVNRGENGYIQSVDGTIKG